MDPYKSIIDAYAKHIIPYKHIVILLYESHTKVGEKTKILLARVSDMWHGKKDDDKKSNNPLKSSHHIICFVDSRWTFDVFLLACHYHTCVISV